MLNLAIATLLILPQTDTTLPEVAVIDSLFPAPSGPLTLEISDPENHPTVADLVRKYCELTGQNAITSADTQALLDSHRLHLLDSLTVSTEEVQHTFELLLRRNDFTLRILKDEGVRLIEIHSLQTQARNNLRSGALFLEPGQLGVAARHPAMLFNTVVTLPHLDVRQVSNSMRTMITDANTQQMLPAGNSNSMVLVGFGDSVVALAEMLLTIDDASATHTIGRTPVQEVIRLENAVAEDVANLLRGALGVNSEAPDADDPKILSDQRTNSLILVTTAKRMAYIKDLIVALDAK